MGPRLMSNCLALFDLDNTLLNGDSDHAWGEFLIYKGLVTENNHRAKNDQFYEDYRNESLDLDAYVAFTIKPILNLSEEQRTNLHKEFMTFAINDAILPKARKLVHEHKSRGDFCVIITATNNYITAPIAQNFQIDLLLATDLEIENGYFTGMISGIPCYRKGKLDKIEQWLENSNSVHSLANSTFYSDSINDLPLLEAVQTPIAVDPDDALLHVSQKRGWKVISLR